MKRAIMLCVSVLGIWAGQVSGQVSLSQMGLLPGDLSVGPATNSQQDLTIAKGADTYLVAWSDSRARSSGSQTIQSDADIFGIRLDSTGAPIDAAPFLIAGGMGLQNRPTVAWNGENWLVLYQSQDPAAGYYDTFIRAVRVSAAGQTLDATPLSFPPDLFSPSTIGLTVSGQGGQWLVARCVYHTDGYGTFLAGQRIAGDGHLVDPTPIMLNDWVYGPLKVAANNGEYMVIGPEWNDASVLKARRISATLQPLAPSFNLPPVSQGVGTSGTELYVTWIANFTDLVGSRMTNTGTLLNPAGTMLFPNFSGELGITHDGTKWWLSRSISDTAALIRLDASGNRLDPIGGVPLPIAVSGSVNSLYNTQIVPRTGGGVMYAWTDYRAALGTESNGFVLPVTSANTAGVERCITTSTRNQRNSELAAGPAGMMAVAYISEIANDDRVLVELLNASGNPMSPEPIQVAQAPSIGVCGIAWNGTHFMITWDQSGAGISPTGIVARRMNSDGSFVDSTFAVMPGMAPSIEALGEDFCIAGTRFATYPQFIDLWMNRIDGPTGTPLDGPSGIGLAGGYFSGLTRTRTDGTQWFIATHSQWSHDSSQGDAVLARVPAVGTPAAAFNPTPYSGGTGDLDIAFSGSKYLLVWRTNSLANANNYISGRIMNADGTYATGAIIIAEAAGRQLRPTVVWDGTNFLVAWDDQRNQQSFFDDRTDIYATRVSEAGVVLDPAGFPVLNGANGEASASMISLNGSTLIASTRFVLSGGFDSYRIGLSRLGRACPADFNGSGAISVQDIFDFLNAWFAGNPAADINGSGLSVQDIFDFLNAWFTGC